MRKVEVSKKPCGCVISVDTVSVQCDCCKKEYTNDLDIQEFTYIKDTGGFHSAIGDCVYYECDLCSECVSTQLGKYLRFPEGQDGQS